MPYCECDCFERKLAYHTAPALLGINPSSLFSLCIQETDNDEIEKFNDKAAIKGLKLKVMCECRNRRLIMLYNESRLKKQLYSDENSVLLEQYGYNKSMTLDDMLGRLSMRISESDSFPHEIGVFLGYPVKDVCGFIENSGENFILCGYWKVYSNAEKARRTFENYDKCRRFLYNKLCQGSDIYQALKIS